MKYRTNSVLFYQDRHQFQVYRKTEQQEMGHRPRVLVMLIVCLLAMTQFCVETDTSAVASLVTAASLVPLITSLCIIYIILFLLLNFNS